MHSKANGGGWPINCGIQRVCHSSVSRKISKEDMSSDVTSDIDLFHCAFFSENLFIHLFIFSSE